MEKRRIALALGQSFLLILGVIAMTFIIASETPTVSAVPLSIRNIPAGRSTDPYSNAVVKEISSLGPEDVAKKYSDIQAQYPDKSNTGTKNAKDLLGIAGTTVGSTLAMGGKTVASTIASLGIAGPFVVIAGAAFAGGQLVKMAVALLGGSGRNVASAGKGALVGAAVGAVATVALVWAVSVATAAAAGAAVTVTATVGAMAALGSTLGIIASAGAVTGPVGWIAAAIAIVVALAWTAFSYQDYSREVFTYQPGLWQPVEGGERCEECNTLPYGCSEYQCHTYGTACELINPDSVTQKCVWKNKDDLSPPKILTMNNSLLSDDYSYKKTDQGAELKYKNGCLPAFKGVTFGIQTDKPAECRYDRQRKIKFNEMAYPTNFGITAYLEEHRVAISNAAFPSQYAAQDLGLNFEDGKNQEIYFMCKSVNGYSNPTPFLLTFCIDDSPDLTAPEITGSTPLSNAYVAKGTLSTPFEIYTDEPADCKWDYKDISYEEMNNSMDNCSQNFIDYTFEPMTYGCTGELNGIKDDTINEFFVRCKDKPTLNETDEDEQERRMENEESYQLNLIGTKELVLDRVTVNGEESGAIIKDSTNVIEIDFVAETSQGAEKNGNARCAYNLKGTFAPYEFSNEDSFELSPTNTEKLNLGEGRYSYNIACCDLANNCDTAELNFTIETDLTEPSIARAYKDENKMKIITTEYSNCFFGTESCSYEIKEGIALTSYDNIEHTTSWDIDIDKFIKCEDEFGNAPGPTECSIIIRGFKS